MARGDFASGARRALQLPPAFRLITAAALALCLAASPIVASAALYKWTDANGRVVYSDQPPIGDIKTEIIAGRAAAIQSKCSQGYGGQGAGIEEAAG